MTEENFKEQGNTEFQNEQFLKAAALYSKAIKQDPTNAVLYSNRSAALLKLKKVSKALEDAEEVIKLRPEWEKGYFRKGAILEDQERFAEALEVYQQAHKLNPDNKELTLKVRTLHKLVAKTMGKAAQAKEKSVAPAAAAAAAQAAASNGQAEDYGSPEINHFVKEYLEHLVQEIEEKGASGWPPMVHFLPGAGAEPHEPQETHILGQRAFESPETVGNFVGFLRGNGAKLDAQAVLMVVPKQAVAYPQVWLKPSWPCGKTDGVIVQLETRERLKKRWFVPVTDKVAGTPTSISADFSLLPPVLA